MKALSLPIASFAVVLATHAAASGPSDEARRNWPQWRGPLANGSAPEADPPLEWGESKNVKWKVAIPGGGTSTPVVWGNRVFVLSAVRIPKTGEVKPAEEKPAGAGPAEQPPREGQPPGAPGGGAGRRGGFGRSEKPTDSYQFVVMCLDRSTGKTLWQKTAREEVPHEGHHQDHGFASGSPVTDGQLLIAYFGSRGLHCYDMEGNLKWTKDFGDLETKNDFGEGASPVLHGDVVVVNWDDETDNDFITALDKRTGKELWKTPRSDDTTWSTPIIVEHNKKFQVVVSATRKVRSYDLETGKELWSCGGQTPNAIPSPVADASTVYLTSGFRGSALQAVALGQTGDLTGTEAIRWGFSRNTSGFTPYVPSPLLTDGLLYLVKGNSGMLTCVEVKTGTPHFEEHRLEGLSGVYASPVSTKDHIYVLGRDGKCLVLRKGQKVEILASNKLDDRTDASIAVVGKQLFIRGHQNLYCIAEN